MHTFLNEMNIEDNDKKYQLETDLFGVVDQKQKEDAIAFNKQVKNEYRKKVREQKEKIGRFSRFRTFSRVFGRFWPPRRHCGRNV